MKKNKNVSSDNVSGDPVLEGHILDVLRSCGNAIESLSGEVNEASRKAAVVLRRGGVDASLVARALGVSKGTVAAWLANDTRGAYGPKIK